MNEVNPAQTEDRKVVIESAQKDVNWDDFRDHLATADKEGRRKWVYPRKPSGRFYRWRTWLSWLLLVVLFAGPFVRINGNPLLLVNIVERKFAVLGQVFWPQDGVILAIGLLIFLVGIVIFTAAYGRLWCGWVCPQTVLMELVFRKIEYAIDGDAVQQRALALSPWTGGKIVKRVLKYSVFLGMSFIVGNTLLAYIIGSDALTAIITDNPANHLHGLTFMVSFTLIFFGIFARFREQACTFICPYGRFQSTLIDENSIVVAYDYKRGEKRGALHRGQTPEQRTTAGQGDCIDCHQCVTICPTGIDIRNGTQMECVHCTACIDACDAVMDKIKRPRGLIRYASLDAVERGQKTLKVTPRLIGYTCILLALVSLEIFLIFSRTQIGTTVLRAPGALFQQMPNGKISNLYLLKLINKTPREMPIEVKLENLEGTVTVLGKDLVVPPQQRIETSVLIELSPAQLKRNSTEVILGIYSGGKQLQKVKTGFIGPRKDT